MKRNTILLITGIIIIIGLFIFNAFILHKRTDGQPGMVQVADSVEIGGDFELINQNNEKVSNLDFRGKYMLIYFGFTNCPMICPTDMAIITDALELLDEKSLSKIQPIFITVDPDRDTQAQIRKFLKDFHPNFVGLTGDKEQINKAHKAYKVYASKVEDGAIEGYDMAHSSFTYLMGKRGEFITLFNHETPPENIAQKIKQLR